MVGTSNALRAVEGGDLEWCHDIIESVSRTFAVSIDLLDEPMSSELCVGYLICRIADTVEDEPNLTAAEKNRLLEAYDSVLAPTGEGDVDRFVEAVDAIDTPDTTDWQLVSESARVIRTYEHFPPAVKTSIRPPARELVDGMRTFVRRYANEPGIRIQTEEELAEYCHYVAGVIGRLITNLQLWNGEVVRDPDEMRHRAESFGHLLQLVNIAKDVHTDYIDERNVYLPASWLAAVDVPQEDVLAAKRQRAVATVVERTADRARDHLDDAQIWLESLSPHEENMLAACAVPFFLAVATLRELEARPTDALSEGGVKISRKEVMTIVASVTTNFDQASIAPLRESVAQGELT